MENCRNSCFCGKRKTDPGGVKTAIVGKPNAGKSSLLNFLLGEERAIVTEVEGTTRDILTETVQMGDITLNVADTAGIRDTQDQVEKIGVERARKNALEADLIIYVTDSSGSWMRMTEPSWRCCRGKR